MDLDLIFRQVEEVKNLLGPDARAASEDQIFQYLEEAGDSPDPVKMVAARITNSLKATLRHENEAGSIDLTLSPSIDVSNRGKTVRSIDLTQAPDTPTSESLQSTYPVVDQFSIHEASFTGSSISNTCTSGIIHSEKEILTNKADLPLAANSEFSKRKLPETYQGSENSSKRLKFDGNPKDILYDQNNSTDYDTEVSELDFVTAEIDLDLLFGESNEYDQAALEKLQNVFPNTDPDFIKENMKDEGINMTDQDVNDLINKLLEKTDKPTLKDYNARETNKKEISRVALMTVSDFIEEYEDPHAHFCEPKLNTVTDIYKENAIYHLRHIFSTHYSEDVKTAFATCGYNFIKTARMLEGVQTGKGKKPLEPLPKRPEELDSVTLLEVVYYKLAEQIMQRQRDRKNSRRIKLDTARFLEEVVECEKCHNDSLFQEIGSCPDGHLLCKYCIVAIARKDHSTPDIACPGRWPGGPGCGAIFPLSTLKPLLPIRLINQMESRRQPMCPFCNNPLLLTEKMDLGQCLACDQISCILCRTKDHSPLKCGEIRVKSQLGHSDSRSMNIVVDTCVLLDNLSVVKQIAHNRLKGGQPPQVWIPWIVLQELDHIKDKRKTRSNLQWKARTAGKWIHECLSQSTNTVRGQNTEEEKIAAEKFTAQCPDDKILQFCLYLRDSESEQMIRPKVLLLTNDINLSSKALIHGISTAKRGNFQQKLEEIIKRKENT